MDNICNATRAGLQSALTTKTRTVDPNYVMDGIKPALKGKRSNDNHWKLESEMNFIVLDGTYTYYRLQALE